MSTSVIGIDITKQRFEAALLVNSKIKNKSFKNTTEGFESLSLWLDKQGSQMVHACLEATGNYGEDRQHPRSKYSLNSRLPPPRLRRG
jgi:transposase